MKIIQLRHKQIPIMPLIFFFLLTGCGFQPANANLPYVWFDVPIDGLSVPRNQQVHIEGHASYNPGIARIELWVNGDLYQNIDDPDTLKGLARFDTFWMPPDAGDYTLQIVAIGPDGATSAPDSVRVHVETATDGVTPTPVLTLTPTEVPEEPSDLTPSPTPPTEVPDEPTFTPTPTTTACAPSAVFIQNAHCRHGPGTVYDILTSLLQGQSVSVEGRNQDSTWWWILLPESSAHCWVSAITVDAVCIPPDLQVVAAPPTPTFTPTPVTPSVTPTNTPTPTIPPDTTPPLPPTLLKPVNGTAFTCIAGLALRWSAVSDPSGIAEYRVQVERHSGDNNWQPMDGSPWTGLTATELELTINNYPPSIACGWHYRWRVQAVDGAGNVGAFSGWFTFTN
jgi:hypothetical protein